MPSISNNFTISKRIDRNQLIQFSHNYAIIIGVKSYPLINGNLKTPIQDAEGLKQTLIQQQGYREEEVLLITDPTKREMDVFLNRFLLLEQKTSGSDPESILPQQVEKEHQDTMAMHFPSQNQPLENIRKYAKWEAFIQKIENNKRNPNKKAARDSLIFYFAGHGLASTMNDDEPAGYMLVSDTSFEATSLAENDTVLPMAQVFEAINALNCHHTLMILDCCFAGAFRFLDKTRASINLNWQPLRKIRFERFLKKKALQVLVSAGPAEKAADLISDRGDHEIKTNGLKHSPFAEALIDALSGKHDVEVKPPNKFYGDGVLTAFELFIYLHNEVEKRTRAHKFFKPQNPDIFSMGAHDGGQFIFSDPRHPKNSPDWDDRSKENPYKGLDQMDIPDSSYYFGRATDLANLMKAMPLEEMTSPTLLLVTGSSGIGKSSLVKAGLLAKWLEEGTGYDYFQITPGERPWTIRKFNPKNLAWEKIEFASDAILPIANRRDGNSTDLFQLDPTKKQILLVDQYENLFTDYAEAERKGFEQDLTELFIQAQKNPFKIILSMRSDFEWQLERSDLGQNFYFPDSEYNSFFHLYRLASLGLEDLRFALTMPAMLQAFEFEKNQETNLVDIILEDLNYQSIALPLLSYTMQELVKHTDPSERLLKIETYQSEVGGVNKILGKRMDQFFGHQEEKKDPQSSNENIPPQEPPKTLDKLKEIHQIKQAKQNLFLRLIQLTDGEYSRRRLFRSEAIDELNFDDDTIESILTHLTEALLISRGGENKSPFIELVHDAQINSWTTGKEWINQFGHENLLLQRRLWQSVTDYHDSLNNTESNDLQIRKENDNQDLATSLSLTWELDPKLEVLTKSILDPEDRWLYKVDYEFVEKTAKLIWGEHLNEEEIQYLRNLESQSPTQDLPTIDKIIQLGQEKHQKLFGPSEVTLDLNQALQLLMNNWLNKPERLFIKKSWELRLGRIQQLTQERNQALATAKRANSNVFAFKAEAQVDRSLGFRLADLGAQVDPENPIILEKLIEKYYTPSGIFHKSLVGHWGALKSVNFSPNSEMVASTGDDNVIRIWSTHTGQELVVFARHAQHAKFARFINNNLVISFSDDRSIRFWELDTKQEKTAWRIEDAFHKIVRVDFSEAKKQVYALGRPEDSNNKLALFSIRVWQLQEDSNTGAFSDWVVADQSKHAELGFQPTIEVPAVTLSSGEQITGHKSVLKGIHYINGFILTTSDEPFILQWNVDTKTIVRVFETPNGHSPKIHFLGPNTTQFISNSTKDNKIRRWDLRSGTEINVWEDSRSDRTKSIRMDNSMSKIIHVNANGLDVYSLRHNRLQKLHELRAHRASDPVTAIDISPDGRWAATVSWDREVKVWDLNSNKRNAYRLSPGQPTTVAGDPMGDFFLTGHQDGTLKIWKPEIFDLDPENFLDQQIDEFPVHEVVKNYPDPIKLINPQPGSGDLFVLVSGKTIEVFQILEDIQVIDFFENEVEVEFASLNKDGTKVIFGDRAGHVKIKALEEKGLAFNAEVHTRRVTSVAFSPVNDQLFLSGSLDRTLVLGEIKEGVLHKIPHANPNLNTIKHVGFSENGKHFYASGLEFFKSYGVDKPTVELLSFRHEDDNWVQQCFYCNNDQWVITISGDRWIKIWDPNTGNLQLTINTHPMLRLNRAPVWGHFNSLEKSLLVISKSDEVIKFWLDPEELVKEAIYKFNFTPLTPNQIEDFDLGGEMENLGFIDANGSVEPLIQTGNERLIFNVGEYYRREQHRFAGEKRRIYNERATNLLRVAKRISQSRAGNRYHTDYSYRERRI